MMNIMRIFPHAAIVHLLITRILLFLITPGSTSTSRATP